MRGDAGWGRALVAAAIGAIAAVVLLAAGSYAIGPGPVTFGSPGPDEAALASTSLRVDSMTLRPATSDGGEAVIDLTVTNAGPRDAVGVGYVLEDGGVVVDYDEASVLHPGAHDFRHLHWKPVGHGVHALRVVIGDGNVHWLRQQLRTGVFDDSIAAARRRRPAGAFVLTALAGLLVSSVGFALRPHLWVSPLEVIPDRAPDPTAS